MIRTPCLHAIDLHPRGAWQGCAKGLGGGQPHPGFCSQCPVRLGLGDAVEKLVKPIAKALKLPCLDEQHRLKPDSGCAKRREKLNALGSALQTKLA